MSKAILSLSFLILLCCVASAEQFASPSGLSLSIGDQGTVSAVLRIVVPQTQQESIGTVGSNNGLLIVALPIRLESNRRVISAPNIKVSIIDLNESSSLLSVILPSNLTELSFTIDNATRLIETPEGKARLDLDLSFKSMTAEEQHLLTLPYSVSSFNIRVILPRKYDETAVNLSSNIIKKTDERTFFLSAEDNKTSSSVWIVFPSPMQNNLDYAKLILTFLISGSTILFQIPGFRERGIKWSIGMLVISLVILGLTAYYSFVLAKKLDFLLFASAALPYTVYGLFASVYLFCAKRFQATITGQVRIAGSPSLFTKVFLHSIQPDGQTKPKPKKEKRTGREGVYVFYVWQGKGSYKYKILAQGSLTDQKWSAEISASRSETTPVLPLDLTAQVKEAVTGGPA